MDNLEQKLGSIQRWCIDMAKALVMILIGGTFVYLWWTLH